MNPALPSKIKSAAPVKKRRKLQMDDVELMLLSLPTAIWYILFCYLPMFGIIIAFKKYKPLPGGNFIQSLLASDWQGIRNFQFLFKTPDAFMMFRNTILYNALFIALGMVLSVTLAILFTQLRSQKFAKVCQTAMFLPHFLSWVVASYFVIAFLNVEKGVVNRTMISFGLTGINWYAEPKYWPYLLTFMFLWKSLGYNMVMYLATISGIDTALYEASLIDGASKWQQVKYITLPMLRPIMTILLILAVGRIFSSDFGLFYQVPRDQGLLKDVTQTIDVYVYKALMTQNNIGFASAAGLLQSACGLVLILGTNIIVWKIDPENTLF